MTVRTFLKLTCQMRPLEFQYRALVHLCRRFLGIWDTEDYLEVGPTKLLIRPADDELMTFKTSEVAASCSSASSRSRFSCSNCSGEWSTDAGAIFALRVLGLLARCSSAGRPLPPRRCMSSPYGGFTTMLNFRQTFALAPMWQDVRFGSKADMCGAPTHVRFTPESDRESGFPHKVMSASPPKRTDAVQNEMSAMGHKRSGSHDQFIRRDREERQELVSQRKLAE
jgi:hypothetical protein